MLKHTERKIYRIRRTQVPRQIGPVTGTPQRVPLFHLQDVLPIHQQEITSIMRIQRIHMFQPLILQVHTLQKLRFTRSGILRRIMTIHSFKFPSMVEQHGLVSVEITRMQEQVRMEVFSQITNRYMTEL